MWNRFVINNILDNRNTSLVVLVLPKYKLGATVKIFWDKPIFNETIWTRSFLLPNISSSLFVNKAQVAIFSLDRLMPNNRTLRLNTIENRVETIGSKSHGTGGFTNHERNKWSRKYNGSIFQRWKIIKWIEQDKKNTKGMARTASRPWLSHNFFIFSRPWLSRQAPICLCLKWLEGKSCYNSLPLEWS